MIPHKHKETTKAPAVSRILEACSEDVDGKRAAQLTEELMGRRPEVRRAFK